MASVEQDIEIGANGEGISLSAPVRSEAPRTGIHLIHDLVEDPDVPISQISRVIALEIVNLLAEMVADDPLRRGTRSQRDLNDQVKGYRELQKTLTESEILSKKDSLNLDGPKFQFVLGEIFRFFQQSLEDMKLDPETAKLVMKHFGDHLRKNEGDLRKNLNKLDSPGRS